MQKFIVLETVFCQLYQWTNGPAGADSAEQMETMIRGTAKIKQLREYKSIRCGENSAKMQVAVWAHWIERKKRALAYTVA